MLEMYKSRKKAGQTVRVRGLVGEESVAMNISEEQGVRLQVCGRSLLVLAVMAVLGESETGGDEGTISIGRGKYKERKRGQNGWQQEQNK